MTRNRHVGKAASRFRATSCAMCRIRHSRCDKSGPPCEFCIRMGTQSECIYPSSASPRDTDHQHQHESPASSASSASSVSASSSPMSASHKPSPESEAGAIPSHSPQSATASNSNMQSGPFFQSSSTHRGSMSNSSVSPHNPSTKDSHFTPAHYAPRMTAFQTNPVLPFPSHVSANSSAVDHHESAPPSQYRAYHLPSNTSSTPTPASATFPPAARFPLQHASNVSGSASIPRLSAHSAASFPNVMSEGTAYLLPSLEFAQGQNAALVNNSRRPSSNASAAETFQTVSLHNFSSTSPYQLLSSQAHSANPANGMMFYSAHMYNSGGFPGTRETQWQHPFAGSNASIVHGGGTHYDRTGLGDAYHAPPPLPPPPPPPLGWDPVAVYVNQVMHSARAHGYTEEMLFQLRKRIHDMCSTIESLVLQNPGSLVAPK
ncbi:N-terminal GAL4-like Zn2Cys6 binuclear cluster DNA-binding domain-containing protein [Andalucia godoyi]|uniref:N-terminal GAL4-like Zn2Cys6 binuclear cluster DNA-binding domain-containing protein n=1 Tax=Andalucia godoyi TaxID=505711 RepID=A0A8K0AGM2_ANDGO|nr:N-terminal GAL4-like Zn2Cys6 binuclear cluster DNA-binding domain-containing protein [Andalucia godoyi]|eukprot:ANDGO_08799.mRNA.1 N-terminal GAL4-like Zn2Cys6 binuclear cluster DNA-binding domain-containing protein